ncbi:glycosyltransferase [Clavibacter tessellarius]|uniref:Glycosyl transferase n=1 Tax=Clavibacter tessellarius TaxID=31965 RepID=A0A225CCY0_9MICO|nr:glycosyltransferase [Clavibacter michiganensis]MBT1635502.1 glycosyltransferase [Clavibacter michiganensis]OQJ61625.1 glycosyl transferase [Clavibacter michiganensis subsp. tessellarius]UKF32676.1 glycosyltransferase [Clavibacter michiganensis subsp. tessellarius]
MPTEAFSLLLPVYRGDRPEFLRRAFRSSVDDQTLRPDEVVVVRDGPVSAELARTMAELAEASPVPVRTIELERNMGLAYALERGLEACAHDVVARMDADDISLPERFARQLELISGGLDLVGTGMYEFADEVGTIAGRRTPPVGADAISRYARFHDPFNHPTVVYRRAAVRRAGGYLPLGLMEDYYLFARMIQSGARVENLPDPLVMYRVSAGAYARRGGIAQLRAELRLQREFRRRRFTSVSQALRNVLVRGSYRLIPEAVRRGLYRRLITRDRAVPQVRA